MSGHSIEELSHRLGRLESQNRRLKQVGIALVCVSATLVMIGFNAAKRTTQIEAERFVVKDKSGRVRAALSLDSGNPKLALFDESGQEQIALRSTPEQASSLEFYNRGHIKMVLESSSVGATNLHMINSDHQLAAGLYAWPDGNAGLALNRGLAGARLTVKADGTSRFGFADKRGHDRGGWMLSHRDGVLPYDEEDIDVPSIDGPSLVPAAPQSLGSSGVPIPIWGNLLGGVFSHQNPAMAP